MLPCSIISCFGTTRLSITLLVALVVLQTSCGQKSVSNALDSSDDDRSQPSATDQASDAAGKPDTDHQGDSAVASTDPDHGRVANRLSKESSPYLLMHAHNPVDWYPWGPEAFEKAKRENKPIFLSIGYSSCYWCHVMERESFLDPAIARFLNDYFVCIKVDREERPDVDTIYMTALTVYNQLSGSGRGGGWPMSMFLTPSGKPFFGGTYFPARDGDRGVGTGFLTIVQRVHEIWSGQQSNLERDAETLTQLTREEMSARESDPAFEIKPALLTEALSTFAAQYDPEYGGFGYEPNNPGRPKFPEPPNLEFLISMSTRSEGETGENETATAEEGIAAISSRNMLLGTLDHLSMGGIRDHIGGGFHRYSVDRYWRIPHFEKMLYDNGQLASLYARAYQLTQRNDYYRVAAEMLDFVMDELTDDGGAFFSAIDAESEKEEGKFYRWTRVEIEATLTSEQYELFAPIYQIDASPNFEEHYYAPQLAQLLAATAESESLTFDTLDDQLVPLRQQLLAVRNQRPRPITDTKILTSWNGLMIRGFADGGRHLDAPQYVAAGIAAAEFVLANLRTSQGRLLRTFGEGEAKLNAYLNDYAFLVDGLIALHQATGDARWLKEAEDLTRIQVELFWDEANGGFFFTSADHETLLVRSKNHVDGVQPSGNSVSAGNLLYLYEQTGNEVYLEQAEKTIRSASMLLERAPAMVPRLLVAISHYLSIRPYVESSPPEEGSNSNANVSDESSSATTGDAAEPTDPGAASAPTDPGAASEPTGND